MVRRAALFGAISGVAVTLAACNAIIGLDGDPSVKLAGPDGSAGDASRDAHSSDSRSADSPTDAPSRETGPDAGTNLFLAWTGVYTTSGIMNLAFANFSAAAGTRCATQSIAPSCYAIDCTLPGPVPPALPSGKLELYDGTRVLLSATPDMQGIYPTAFSTTSAWKAGDSIGLRTAGGALAMFDVPLTAPAAITLTAPLAESGTLVLDHTQSLSVTWTGTAPKVIVTVSQASSAGTDLTSSSRFICEFDGASGSASVPAAAMATLIPSFVGSTSFNVGGGVTQNIIDGSQPMHIYAIRAQYQPASVK